MTNPQRYFRNNACSSLRLLEVMRGAGVRHIVSSSVVIYGNPDRLPIPETMPPRPVNPYGDNKLHWYGAAHGFTHSTQPAPT